MRDAYLRNPALIHRMVGERRYFSAENPGFVREKPGTIFIAADGASGRQEGDYLPYEGQEFRDFSVRADGYKQGRPGDVLRPDRIYGRRKRQRRLERTAQSRTVLALHCCRFDGGDFRYEKYDLMCGYSFRLGRFDLGMSGEYTAISHSARTIPV